MKNNMSFFQAYGACEIKGKLCFAHLKHNGLYSLNLDNKYLKYLGSVPGEQQDQIYLYTTVVRCKDLVVLVPNYAKKIAIYNIFTNTFSIFELHPDIDTDLGNKFLGAIVIDNMVWMVGGSIPYLLGLDVDTGEQKVVKYTEERINGLYCLGNVCVCDNKLYIALYYKCSVIIIDLYTLKIKEHIINNDADGFSSINIFNGEFVLTSKNSMKVLIMDYCFDTLKTINENEKSLDSDERTLRKSLIMEEILWIIPDQERFLLRINREFEVEKIELSKTKATLKDITDALITMSTVIGNKLVLDNEQDDCLMIFSENQNEVILKKDVIGDIPYINEVDFLMIGENEVIKESDFVGLEDFLFYILQRRVNNDNN